MKGTSMSSKKIKILEKLFFESENIEKRLEALFPLLEEKTTVEKKPICREKLLFLMNKMENHFPKTTDSFHEAFNRLQEMLEMEEKL